MKGLNVLSLFDGISCGRVALERAGIKVDVYYASEIDWYPRQISEGNYTDIKSLGSVTNWKSWDSRDKIEDMDEISRDKFLSTFDKMIKGKNEISIEHGGIPWENWNIDWSSVDLVLAGFPCQSWSMAGQQLGDKDPRGALFWTTLDIIAKVLKHNPNAKFLMENVKMKKEFEEYITYHTEKALGYAEKTLINSALVSAQNRNRFYWTNFKVSQPEDKQIFLRDIVEDIVFIPDGLQSNLKNGCIKAEQNLKGESQTLNRAMKNERNPNEKGLTLTSSCYKGMGTNGMTNVLIQGGALRGRYIVNGKRQDHKMKVAGLTEQRLELRPDSKTNALTTVQKDNIIVYRPCELLDKPTKGGHVANATDIKGNESIKRVYSVDGKSPTLTTMAGGHREPKILTNVNPSGRGMNGNVYNLNNEKSPTLTTNKGEGVKVGLINETELFYRKLTPLECERLQTLPDNYTKFVSNSQRYKAIGNGWTVDVIAHVLSHIKLNYINIEEQGEELIHI